MRPANESYRSAVVASIVFCVLGVLPVSPEAHAQKSASPKAPLTKLDKALRDVRRLRKEKKDDQALALLDSLEANIGDRSSNDFARVLYARAGLWLVLGKEEGWRRDFDTLIAIPNHRQIALARKAHYLSITENPGTLEECQNCLEQIDKTKLTEPDRIVKCTAEYHLARRKRDFDRQLRAAMEANKVTDNSVTQSMVATSLAYCHRLKESKDWFRRAAKSGQDPSLVLYTGAAIISGSDINGAVQLLKESIRARPGAVLPSFLLADMYAGLASQGKPAEPIKPILEAIVDSDCTITQRQEKYLRLSRDSFSKNQLPGALNYATKANSIQSDTTTLLLIAQIYNAMARYDQAINWYKKLLAVRPGDPGALTQLAVCYARLEDHEKAIELCSRALAIEPNQILALKTRGALQIVVGRDREAVADVKRLQALEPEKSHSIDTLRALGVKYTSNLISYYQSATESWKQDDIVRLTQLEKQIEKTSNKTVLADLFQEMSRLELGIGDYEKAYEHTQKSVSLGNETYRVHAIAAASLFALNRRAEAKKERQIAVSLHFIQRSASNRKDNNEKIR